MPKSYHESAPIPLPAAIAQPLLVHLVDDRGYPHLWTVENAIGDALDLLRADRHAEAIEILETELRRLRSL